MVMNTYIFFKPHFNYPSTRKRNRDFPLSFTSQRSMLCCILCIILSVHFVKPTLTYLKAVWIRKSNHSVYRWCIDLLPDYMKRNKQTMSTILHATWGLLPSLVDWGNATCDVCHCYCLILCFICRYNFSNFRYLFSSLQCPALSFTIYKLRVAKEKFLLPNGGLKAFIRSAVGL